MSARSALLAYLQQAGLSTLRAEAHLDAYAHELTEKIQSAMEEVREADWGKSTRSKRPYLQGMERAKKAINPEVLNGG